MAKKDEDYRELGKIGWYLYNLTIFILGLSFFFIGCIFISPWFMVPEIITIIIWCTVSYYLPELNNHYPDEKSQVWEKCNCESCGILLDKYGIDDLDVCEICGHCHVSEYEMVKIKKVKNNG